MSLAAHASASSFLPATGAYNLPQIHKILKSVFRISGLQNCSSSQILSYYEAGIVSDGDPFVQITGAWYLPELSMHNALGYDIKSGHQQTISQWVGITGDVKSSANCSTKVVQTGT